MYKVVKRATTRDRRKAKIRGILRGTAEHPRLTVFRSNKYIYGQIIDDVTGLTLVSSSDSVEAADGNKSVRAFAVGKNLAKKALEKKIKLVKFDRNGYKFHGRVKSLADGAKEGGLVL